MDKNYQLGLLYLLHLLIGADGNQDIRELTAFEKICENEQIPGGIFKEFKKAIQEKKEREIYQTGIEHINQCPVNEKLKVFVMLYKMSEIDGRVNVKEIKLLLYSLKMAGIEFEDVVHMAKATPSLL